METPPLIGKDLALILRADTTAPVFNDEEKRARAYNPGTQSCSLRATASTSAAWQSRQGVTGRPLWSLGLGMLGPHRLPHGTCQRSHKRFAPSCGPSGPVVRPKSWEAIPFVSLGGLQTVPRASANVRCPTVRSVPA